MSVSGIAISGPDAGNYALPEHHGEHHGEQRLSIGCGDRRRRTRAGPRPERGRTGPARVMKATWTRRRRSRPPTVRRRPPGRSTVWTRTSTTRWKRPGRGTRTGPPTPRTRSAADVDFDSAGHGQPATIAGGSEHRNRRDLAGAGRVRADLGHAGRSSCPIRRQRERDRRRRASRAGPGQWAGDHGAGGDGRRDRPGGAPHALRQRADDREFRHGRRRVRVQKTLPCSMAAAGR